MSKAKLNGKLLNRSERNAGVVTAATYLFKDLKFLLERPIEMEFYEYKIMQKFQQKLLRRALR